MISVHPDSFHCEKGLFCIHPLPQDREVFGLRDPISYFGGFFGPVFGNNKKQNQENQNTTRLS